MLRIRAGINTRSEIGLIPFLEMGLSFAICRERHAWPPLTTFNAFLQCCCDDTGDGSILRWDPFELSATEYLAALRTLDPVHRIETLDTQPGDWERWFGAAVDLPS